MVKFFSIIFTVFVIFFAMIPNIYASVPVATCKLGCPRSPLQPERTVECCRAHEINPGGGTCFFTNYIYECCCRNKTNYNYK